MKRAVASLILAALAWPALALAGEVIAHPSVSLDADEVRDLYLGERQFAGSLRLVPVDNHALRPEFLSRVLHTDERKYAARWRRKAFREGLQAPALKGSDAEVIQFVKATPGAVGYVTKGVDGVKVLDKF
jgi:hypothetical protein